MGKTTVLAWGCDGPECEETAPRIDDIVPDDWFHAIVGVAPVTARTKKKVYHSLPCLVSDLVGQFGTGDVVLDSDPSEGVGSE